MRLWRLRSQTTNHPQAGALRCLWLSPSAKVLTETQMEDLLASGRRPESWERVVPVKTQPRGITADCF